MREKENNIIRKKFHAKENQSMWANRNYLLLWSGQVISSVGSQASIVAFPLLVLALTGSVGQAGFIGATRLLPYLLLSLPVGALIDRWNRKRVMILCDTGRALSMASIPIAFASGHLTLVQLYIVSLIEGTLYVFFNIAEVACLPQIVTKEQLPTATAQSTLIVNTSFLIGPALGGALFGFGKTLPFLVDAVSYAASVLSLFAITAKFQQERQGATRKLYSEISEGLSWLWHHSLIRIIALLAWGNTILVAGISLIIIDIAELHHISSADIGFILASGGAGGVSGVLLARVLINRFSFWKIICGSSWLWTLLLPFYAIVVNPFILGMLLFIFAATLSVYDVQQFTYRLTLIPDHLQGRVNSVFRLISFSGQPLGLALTGMLLQRIQALPVILVTSVGLILLGIIRTLNPEIRHARPLHELQEEREAI